MPSVSHMPVRQSSDHRMALQIAKLTQQVKTLERENGMLRQIIKNIQNPGDRSVPDAP